MPVNTNLLRKTKENGKIESVQFHVKGVKNLVWDGVVPEATSSSSDVVVEDESEDPSSNGPDDIWQNMATVGEEERNDEHRAQRRRT
jgi:predicted 3-demethylubiquinone-9 3-methyltransferase (glyoxalase superfamily)